MRAIISIFIAVLLPPCALAQVNRDETDSMEYAEVGAWKVRIDQSLTFGCFAYAVFEDGTGLRIGWAPASQKLYVMIGGGVWTSVEAGSEYQLSARFGNSQAWNITATGISSAGRNGLAFEATNEDFVTEFVTKPNVEFFVPGATLGNFSLIDSSLAFSKMVECQKVVQAAITTTLDPTYAEFKSNDPFD